MQNNLYKTTDLAVYDNIINGIYRPYLPENSKLCNIKSLFRLANTRTVLHSVINTDIDSLLKNIDLTSFGYQSLRDFETEIKENSIKGTFDVIIFPNKIYKLRDFIDIPQPPDRKCVYYLALIQDEHERIKLRSKKVLESTVTEKHLSFYANKNMQKAQNISYDARILLSRFIDKGLNIYHDSDAYIIFVLNLFLIRIILFYSNFFKSFISPFYQSEEQMRLEFFHSIPVHRKYPYVFSYLPASVGSDQLDNIPDIAKKSQNSPSQNINPMFLSQSNNMSHSLISRNSTPLKTALPPLTRLQWCGQVNVLVDMLLSLSTKSYMGGHPVLNASPEQLKSFIQTVFVDKSGQQFSEATLTTLLKPATKKLPKNGNPKRIDLSDVL